MKAALVAGDRRQLFLAQMLQDAGFKVSGYKVPGFDSNKESLRDAVFGAELVVLPCPMGGGTDIKAGEETIPLAGIISALPWGGCLAGGKPSPSAALLACGMGYPIYDYLSPDETQIMNAVPTAEGALALAIQNTDGTVFGSNALITGFGRCGMRLALLLLAAGAKVTVAARRPEARALAESMGCGSVGLESLALAVEAADMVFNTVPSRIFGEAELSGLGPSVPYIELASSPGGADRSVAGSMGVRYVDGGGLPGKTAPKAAAEYIFRRLISILDERGQR